MPQGVNVPFALWLMQDLLAHAKSRGVLPQEACADHEAEINIAQCTVWFVLDCH